MKTQLSKRERAVAILICRGWSSKQIAGELCISIKTVEKHRQSVYDKSGIHNMVILTHWALATGLVQNHYADRFKNL